MRCISICPGKSIQTAHSFIIPLLYLLSLIPITAAVLNVFNIYAGVGILAELIASVVNWGITVLLVIAAYRIFSLLLKIKFINRIFEYTSLTRYWRRYRAPGINIKNLLK